MAAQRAPRQPSNAGIPIRRLELKLDPTNVPRDYYANDVHLTTMWSALSVLFPEGEQFFVDAVRHFRDRIDDPQLAADVMAFVGQEAMHSKEHDLLTSILEAHGLKTAVGTDEWLADGLKLVRKVLSPQSQLAATCALEHFTALLAEQLLHNEQYRDLLDESVRGLWVWHALEESEHKTVAFDVYQAVDGSYARRVGIMVLATIVFYAVAAAVYAAMLREQKALFDLRGLRRYASHFWGRKGFFSSLTPAYLEYFRPSFHPNDRNTDGMIAEWNERLFGANGSLKEQLKQVRRPAVRAEARA